MSLLLTAMAGADTCFYPGYIALTRFVVTAKSRGGGCLGYLPGNSRMSSALHVLWCMLLDACTC